jgi:hypothetical protein
MHGAYFHTGTGLIYKAALPGAFVARLGVLLI